MVIAGAGRRADSVQFTRQTGGAGPAVAGVDGGSGLPPTKVSRPNEEQEGVMHPLVIVLMAAFLIVPAIGDVPDAVSTPAASDTAVAPFTAESTVVTGCPVGWYEFEVGANNPIDQNDDGIICMRESGMWGFGHVGRPTDNVYGP
jgi:hypothetical protein